MDIPSTGAIFTLGKSHLAENTQSYFYIKNDPVKRLISGPHQSAVICESGRLFVWGENHFGQLGIGGHSGSTASGKRGGNSTTNGDIVTKPTCVKALKSLGLKICDAAFGNNWSVMLTHSNEIFFTGRNIFPEDTHVAQHFISAQVEQQQCAIIRKPFRLEEFDDYLSKSEETDNFLAVQAGNEHFAVLTTTGRLIGCGSNAQQQLGELEADYDGHPVEIKLDATVQQFACGPESTLVLTASGSLFLTGHLNEFVFPKFTELQKNLSPTEQIIFMHISKASEIYIVSNVGNIYRSFESVRNKSLVFQRFYDYDSEENGPIWKLLKGFSFYAALSKANKFFTTFSESGHHLKTFREISKFKNLRLLDIAVGDQHILVQGIPRSSMASASTTAFVLQPKDANANLLEQGRSSSGRSLTKQQQVAEEMEAMSPDKGFGIAAGAATAAGTAAAMEAVKHLTNGNVAEEEGKATKDTVEEAKEESKAVQSVQANYEAHPKEPEVNGNEEEAIPNNQKEEQQPTKPQSAEHKQMEPSAPTESPTKSMESPTKRMEPPVKAMAAEVKPMDSMDKLPTPPTHTPTPPPPKSPTDSIGSLQSARFVQPGNPLEKLDSSQEKQMLRPRTPYPDSSNGSTPQTVKKTPIRNFSYEAAMDHEHLERTSPELVDSLETVEEVSAPATIQVSTPTPPTEEDEQLAVEITTTKDSRDGSKVVNEIRFINNGVDVTAKVEEQMPDTSLEDSMEELESDAEQMLQQVEERVEKTVAEHKDGALRATEEMRDDLNSRQDSIQMAVKNAAQEAKKSMEAAGERMATGARGAVDAVGDAVGAAGKSAQRMANDAMHAMEQAGSSAAKAASDTKDSMGRAMDSVTHKISSEVLGAKENISSLFQIKAAREADPQTTPVSTPRGDEEDMDISSKEGGPKTNTTLGSGEEDERTTASVNSNHNSAGNGNRAQFDDSTPFEPSNPYDDPLDAVVERSKKAMQDDLRAMEMRTHSHVQAVAQKTEEETKGFVQQFLDNMRLSCRNERAVDIEDETRPPPPAAAQHHNKNKVNSELSLSNGHGEQQASRVCTIL
ncbi:muscle M-line assembly protein unc-89 [Drosophila persimilis]|uniref:muscle M-line assembly protein unc-89 n=1 Tax=Drosophila persimilis TaxID=7234 RepID=UPI000F099923|nr:muscle M-line assembly protein unc-89 [Drosophila persimilis]